MQVYRDVTGVTEKSFFRFSIITLGYTTVFVSISTTLNCTSTCSRLNDRCDEITQEAQLLLRKPFVLRCHCEVTVLTGAISREEILHLEIFGLGNLRAED